MDSFVFDSHKKPRNMLSKLGIRTLNYKFSKVLAPRRAGPISAVIDYGVTNVPEWAIQGGTCTFYAKIGP